MAPQCGLAPGFVGIVGAHLIGTVRQTALACRLRVGALPQHPTGLLGYAFNWSPEGVVNEYASTTVRSSRKACTNGSRRWSGIETVYVNGVKLEAFTTSGGLGTMCETYLTARSRISTTRAMRYPGHMSADELPSSTSC